MNCNRCSRPHFTLPERREELFNLRNPLRSSCTTIPPALPSPPLTMSQNAASTLLFFFFLGMVTLPEQPVPGLDNLLHEEIFSPISSLNLPWHNLRQAGCPHHDAAGILSGQAAQPELEASQDKGLLLSPPVPARHPRGSLTAARDRQQ